MAKAMYCRFSGLPYSPVFRRSSQAVVVHRPVLLVCKSTPNEKFYVGSDGRKKASLENAAQSLESNEQDSSDIEADDQSAWKFSWQLAERNLTWNEDLAGRLIQVALWSITWEPVTELFNFLLPLAMWIFAFASWGLVANVISVDNSPAGLRCSKVFLSHI